MSARTILTAPPTSRVATTYAKPVLNFWDTPVAGYLALEFPPTTYYLDINGKDELEANGSSTQPWRTLDYAITRLKNIFDDYPAKYTLMMGSGDYPGAVIPYKLIQITGAAGALMAPSTIINGPLIFDLSGYTFQNNGLICGIQGLVLNGGVQFRGGPQNIQQNWDFSIDNCDINASLFDGSPRNALVDVGYGFPSTSRYANGYPSGLHITYSDISGGAAARGVYSSAMETSVANTRIIRSNGGGPAALYWEDMTAGDNTNPGTLSFSGNLYRAKGDNTAAAEGFVMVKVDYTAAKGVFSPGANFNDCISTDTCVDFTPSSVAVGTLSANQWSMTQAFLSSTGGTPPPSTNWGKANVTGATIYASGCTAAGFNNTGPNITWLSPPLPGNIPSEILCGGWHRLSAQTINTTGAPSTISIAWGASSFGDTTTISHNTPNGSNFTINQHGIYLLTLQVSYGSLNTATLTDRTLRTSMALTRSGTTSAIVQGNYDFGDNTPPTPAVTSSAVYELKKGDTLFFQVSQYLSAGSFTLQGKAAAPADFDLNTYWTWTLLKPLP